MHVRIALAFWVGISLGCGSSDSGPPVDFTGRYEGTSTNGASNCPGAWTMGAMGEGQFNIVQSGSDVQFQAQGATSLVLYAVFGSASFTGKAAGNHMEAAIVGSVMNTQGACSYTWKGTLAGDLLDGKLDGTLSYTPNTNGHADCDTLQVTGCTRVTSFIYYRVGTGRDGGP
jgi:hypothetical protein